MRDEPNLFDAGFTLIELILVLILLGILSVYILPRFFDRNTFDTRAFGDEAQAMLRYAQKTAIAQNRPVFVDLAGGRVALCFDAACDMPVPAPSTRRALAVCGNNTAWMCAAIPDNVAVVPADPAFFFNALGRPFNVGDVDPVSSFALLNMTLTSGDLVRAIVVEPETGYVHP